HGTAEGRARGWLTAGRPGGTVCSGASRSRRGRDAAARAGGIDRRVGAAGAAGRVSEDAAALADRCRDLAVAGRSRGAHDRSRRRAPARGAGDTVADDGLAAPQEAPDHAGLATRRGGHLMARRFTVLAILALGGLVAAIS